MPVSRSRGLVRRGRALHSRYMNRTCNVPLDKFNLESSVAKRCNPFKQVNAMSGQKSSSKEASFRGVLKELNSLVDNSDLVEEIESPTPVKSSSPTQNENLADKSSSPTQNENLADPFKCFMVNPQEKSNNKEIKSISAESSPDASLAIPLDNNLGSSSLKGRCSASGDRISNSQNSTIVSCAPSTEISDPFERLNIVRQEKSTQGESLINTSTNKSVSARKEVNSYVENYDFIERSGSPTPERFLSSTQKENPNGSSLKSTFNASSKSSLNSVNDTTTQCAGATRTSDPFKLRQEKSSSKGAPLINSSTSKSVLALKEVNSREEIIDNVEEDETSSPNKSSAPPQNDNIVSSPTKNLESARDGSYLEDRFNATMENDISSGDKISNPAPISSPVASSTPTSRSKPNLNISSNTEEESDPNSKNVTAERILTVNSTRNSSRSNVSRDTNTSNGSSTMEDSDVFGDNAVNGNWVQAVLTKSSDGRGVLKWYKDRGSLVARKRNTLVKIIIDKELDIDPSVGIKGERFEALARAIVALFPTECSETYYIPRHVDIFQKVKPARGKLYDRWINKRRQLRSEGIICKDNQSIDEPSEEIVRDAEALEPEISKAIELLKLYEQLDEDAQNALAISLYARISLFSASKVHDISKYLQSYPLLAQTEGYRLIHADFARLHPEKAQALYHNWSNFACKITKYAADLLPITQTLKKQVQILNIDLTLEDEKNRDLNALYLLSLLLPALTVKRNWKPSKIECKDAFFLQRSTIQEAADKLRQRERQLKANNIPPQPTPVLIGSAHSREVYVCIGNVLYKVGSVLGAVDICCKLFMTLKTELPPDCILPWLFIIAFIYGVDAGNQAVKYPSLTTLKKDIGL